MHNKKVPGRVEQQIIIGTPGTVNGLIRRNKLNVRKVQILVIDEVDVMLDTQGLGQQSQRVKKLFLSFHRMSTLISKVNTDN